MKKEEVLILFEDIKYLMKTCDFIKIAGNIAVGVENKYIFKEVPLSLFISNELYIIKSSEIMNIYKITDTDNAYIENNNLVFEFDQQNFSFNLDLITLEVAQLFNIEYLKLKQISSFVTNTYNNLEKNEQFMQIMNLKTSDGSTMFKLDNYIFSLYKGLLPINKGNSVNLNISNQLNYFICDFTVLKPKGKYVKILLAYLNLLRN